VRKLLTVAALAGALALAGAPAHAAASGSGTGLTITPALARAAAGAHDVRIKVTVWNFGSAAVQVTTAEREMTRPASGHCRLNAKPTTASSWAQVTPAAFSLAAGQSEVTTVTVKAPASATGTHDIAVIYAAESAGSGKLRAAAAVGMQTLITLSGKPAPVARCVSLAPPRATAAGVPGLPGAAWAGIGAVLALAVAFVLGRLTSRRRA
jgi:hypothetical protein